MGSWESTYSVVSLCCLLLRQLDANDGLGSDREYSALFSGEVPKNTPEVVSPSVRTLLSRNTDTHGILCRHRMDLINVKLIFPTSNAEMLLLRLAQGFSTRKAPPSSPVSAYMRDSDSTGSICLNWKRAGG